jgi:hypothetical protein
MVAQIILSNCDFASLHVSGVSSFLELAELGKGISFICCDGILLNLSYDRSRITTIHSILHT